LAKNLDLRVERRETVRKRLNELRRSGMIPANVYGHAMESIPIQIDRRSFESVVASATQSTLINLQLDGASDRQTVLVRDIQWDRLRGQPLHVDFFAVRPGDRVHAAVPVALHGQAPAARAQDVMLLQPIKEVHLDGSPTDLPNAIEVDVSGLTDVDQAIYARDLRLPASVTLLDNPDEVIVKVQRVARLAPEEVVEPKVEEKAEEAEAAPAEEAASEDTAAP